MLTWRRICLQKGALFSPSRTLWSWKIKPVTLRDTCPASRISGIKSSKNITGRQIYTPRSHRFPNRNQSEAILHPNDPQGSVCSEHRTGFLQPDPRKAQLKTGLWSEEFMKLHKLHSKLRFPPISNENEQKRMGANARIYKLVHVKPAEPCQAQSKSYIKVSC